MFFAPSKPVTLSKSRSICQIPVRNFQCPPKPQIRTLRTWILESFILEIGLSEVNVSLDMILTTAKLYVMSFVDPSLSV